jgi:hypothetical protein
MSNFGQQWGNRGKGEKLRGPSFWLGALITARLLDHSELSPFLFSLKVLLNSTMVDSEELAASAATKRPHSAIHEDENGGLRFARSSATFLRRTANREAV